MYKVRDVFPEHQQQHHHHAHRGRDENECTCGRCETKEEEGRRKKYSDRVQKRGGNHEEEADEDMVVDLNRVEDVERLFRHLKELRKYRFGITNDSYETNGLSAAPAAAPNASYASAKSETPNVVQSDIKTREICNTIVFALLGISAVFIIDGISKSSATVAKLKISSSSSQKPQNENQ
jgi:hypothetical protein